MKYSLLSSFDRAWCGDYQIPASLLSEVSEDKSSKILQYFRLLLIFFLLTELFGYFLITMGLSNERPIWIFISGVVLKIGGSLLSAFFQNKSGILLSLELQKYLEKLRVHSIEIRSFLTDRGCSELEINSLQSLPSEIYQSELSGYQRSRIINIGAPLFCGVALFINGDLITSLVVIILGLLSFPIGERFFRENTFRKESELRLGMAAELLPFVSKSYKEHVWLTTKVNFLSQLPLLLFTFKFIWNAAGHLLSSFFALTQGLIGLTGTLAFQKARVSALRTAGTTRHLIHALSSPSLIITPQRWKEHTQHKDVSSHTTEKRNGVVLQNFSPTVPFQEKKIPPFSCFITSGSICILKAPSGKGKTTLTSALTHLIEHKGDMIYISDGKVINAHELTREEFDSKLFFIKEENIDKSTRLIDLFKGISLEANSSLLQVANTLYDPLLVELAWKAPDNLIEQEIRNIEALKKSVFPDEMLSFLRDLRNKQSIFIQSILEKAGGNLSTDRIYPERNFATLSSGEKVRLITLLGMENCRTKPKSFVILDEPLTHLDEANINFQLKTLHEMQKLNTPPSLLIISHHFIQEMKNHLTHIQEIDLIDRFS